MSRILYSFKFSRVFIRTCPGDEVFAHDVHDVILHFTGHSKRHDNFARVDSFELIMDTSPAGGLSVCGEGALSTMCGF